MIKPTFYKDWMVAFGVRIANKVTGLSAVGVFEKRLLSHYSADD